MRAKWLSVSLVVLVVSSVAAGMSWVKAGGINQVGSTHAADQVSGRDAASKAEDSSSRSGNLSRSSEQEIQDRIGSGAQEHSAAASKRNGGEPQVWQTPAQAKPSWTYASARVDRIEKMRVMLSQEISIEFQNVPLQDVLAKLEDQLRFQVILQFDELANLGIDPDSPVTCVFRDATAHFVLCQILRPLQLDYRITEVGIQVSSHDDIASEPEIRFYELAYLSDQPIDLRKLIVTLTACVDPEEWMDFGGTGTSRVLAFGSNLVVTASSSTHRKIDEFLAQCSRIPKSNLASEASEGAPNQVSGAIGEGLRGAEVPGLRSIGAHAPKN